MKNKKALLVFSHQLTENQEKELVEEYGVKEIEQLPEELQNMWSNVSIKKDYKEIPVYSYTERNVEEIKEGETVKKISYFKHVKFIKYE